MSRLTSQSNQLMGSLSGTFGATASGPFTPKDIPNLALWLDGNDPNANGMKPLDGANITQWLDKSGNSINFFVEAGEGMPFYIANFSSGNGALLFDGITDCMDAAYSPLINTHDTAVYVVGACNSTTEGFTCPLVTRQADLSSNVFGYNFYKNDHSDGNLWVILLGSAAGPFNEVVDSAMMVDTTTPPSISEK